MDAFLPASLAPTEVAVLSLLLDRPGELYASVRQQLSCASVSDRDLTGAGFYRKFTVPPSAAFRRDLPPVELSGVYAEHPDLECGAGFLLFIRDGVVSFLEGFVYGDAEWPGDESAFTFFCEHDQAASAQRST